MKIELRVCELCQNSIISIIQEELRNWEFQRNFEIKMGTLIFYDKVEAVDAEAEDVYWTSEVSTPWDYLSGEQLIHIEMCQIRNLQPTDCNVYWSTSIFSCCQTEPIVGLFKYSSIYTKTIPRIHIEIFFMKSIHFELRQYFCFFFR